MLFNVRVNITLKAGIPNPEAHSIKRKAAAIGVAVSDVQIGKYFELEIEAPSANDVREKVNDMCSKLLANQYCEEHVIVSVHPG